MAIGKISPKKKARPMIDRAALYIRMSTEHQDYSIANQTAALERYAEDNNMTIVKRFVDSGKSGLTLSRRRGLKELLMDVISTEADFKHILVYDVSRWGRFLDSDEAAYYEYTCKKANVKVHYCVEPFINDGSVYSNLLKSLKRIMAGEYSRELSAKVSAAQIRLAQLGFRQGGAAGYGIRRQLVGRDGSPKGWLKAGERKGFQSDRVLLRAGPQNETDVVRQIFRWFVVDGFSQNHIARLLKQRDIEPEYFKKWTDCPDWTNYRVHAVLTNPKYIGAVVYNRTSGKLHTKRVRNAADTRVCREQAFEAIVDPQVYAKAQQIIASRRMSLSNDQILDRLTLLLRKHGRLSSSIIQDDPNTPGLSAIVTRFKSLTAVYELIGYKQKKDTDGIAKRQKQRGTSHGFHCLGEAILAAIACGQLTETFTIGALKAACPGWSRGSYTATCAIYANRDEAKPIKLRRIGRGEYLIVESRPNMRFPMVALDDCQVLEGLALLLKRHGRLSTTIIDEDRNTPSMTAIRRRFRSLRAVYELLGYSRTIDHAGIRKRFQERKALRGPGSMGLALSDAVKTGRLAETFTVAELKASCPGWSYDSYYTMPAYYARTGGEGPIKLRRVAPGQYLVVGLRA